MKPKRPARRRSAPARIKLQEVLVETVGSITHVDANFPVYGVLGPLMMKSAHTPTDEEIRSLYAIPESIPINRVKRPVFSNLGKPAVNGQPSPGIAPDAKPGVPDVGQYVGPAPEERNSHGLRRKMTYCGNDQCPIWPEDTKFKTLYQWAEKVRDWYQIRKVYATVYMLLGMATAAFEKNKVKADRAVRKLRLIYKDEVEKENAITDSMFKKTFEKKEEVKVVKVKAEKDKFGCREGSQGAAVNKVITAVPKSAKKIARQSGQTLARVRNHMKWLVEQGHAVKTENGRYCLAAKEVDIKPKKVKKSMTKAKLRKKHVR